MTGNKKSRRWVEIVGGSSAGTQATSLGLLCLLKRRVDSPELGAQIATDAVDCTDDRERNTGSNQAVFNGGSAGFVVQETRKKFGHLSAPFEEGSKLTRPGVASGLS